MMDWQGNNNTHGPECHCEECERDDCRVITGDRVSVIISNHCDIVYCPQERMVESRLKM